MQKDIPHQTANPKAMQELIGQLWKCYIGGDLRSDSLIWYSFNFCEGAVKLVVNWSLTRLEALSYSSIGMWSSITVEDLVEI